MISNPSAGLNLMGPASAPGLPDPKERPLIDCDTSPLSTVTTTRFHFPRELMSAFASEDVWFVPNATAHSASDLAGILQSNTISNRSYFFSLTSSTLPTALRTPPATFHA